ncbi:MAG: BCD family MFS transporter [Chloroflexi bacterium]|nr:BCD family MFS transporter [Chloroflexota bacterium]
MIGLLAPPPRLPRARMARLMTFQIGSAMADILVASIWNRVMIVELGVPAWPVGLLIAFRYLLAPLSLYAGFRSDTRPLLGYRRTAYIWLGRLLVWLSFPLLPWTLARFATDRGDPLGWLAAFAGFLMYGVGTLFSGSPLLALVRDAVPPARQGLAVSLMETALIICFPIVAIAFSIALRAYSLEAFWQLVLVTMAVSGFFWIFSVAGVERRGEAETAPAADLPFMPVVRAIWQDRRARGFFAFLSLATLSAWAQDAILEPFGAEVFRAGLGETTRYSAYWQGATVVTLLATAWLGRRRYPEQQTRIAQGGIAVMAAGMALMAVAALGAEARLFQLSLVIFGGGFGVYTFGGLNLMTAMTSDAQAGAYLGLWTIAILLSRGVGIGLGGLLRDVLKALVGAPAPAYGAIFALEALGLALALLALARVDVPGFAREHGRGGPREVPLAAEL